MAIQTEQNERISARTSRKAKTTAGVKYVVVEGAPLHYVPGFGVVGPGQFVTLDEGTKPGKFLRAVADSDVAKVAKDPSNAEKLAAAAAAANAAENKDGTSATPETAVATTPTTAEAGAGTQDAARTRTTR